MSDKSAVGFIVLTRQPDGTWQDDWDGFVHVTEVAARYELAEAEARLGAESVRLARVILVEGGES